MSKYCNLWMIKDSCYQPSPISYLALTKSYQLVSVQGIVTNILTKLEVLFQEIRLLLFVEITTDVVGGVGVGEYFLFDKSCVIHTGRGKQTQALVLLTSTQG